MSIDVVFPSSHDVEAWAEDHEAGLKPDLWPYGLNQLGDYWRGCAIGHQVAPELRLSRATSSWGRRITSKRSPATDISVTWDEWTAARVLLNHANSGVFSGVIWATDKSETWKGEAKRRLVLSVLRNASGLWCLSKPQVAALRKELGSDSPPIEYVRFGIDTEYFRAKPYPRRPMVLSVGGDRDRDTGTLFAALALVHSKRPDVELLVQTSSKIPPPPGVRVVSRVPHTELRDLYRQASVVAVATRPNLHVSGMTVSLEAMSTGRPVVISDTPGIQDYVTDGATGHLVSVGDYAGLATEVLALLDDQATARRLGEYGREKVEQGHTTKLMTAQIAHFISDCRTRDSRH